eukprot:1030893-Prorocentrum_minimum.AAC.1
MTSTGNDSKHNAGVSVFIFWCANRLSVSLLMVVVVDTSSSPAQVKWDKENSEVDTDSGVE